MPFDLSDPDQVDRDELMRRFMRGGDTPPAADDLVARSDPRFRGPADFLFPGSGGGEDARPFAPLPSIDTRPAQGGGGFRFMDAAYPVATQVPDDGSSFGGFDINNPESSPAPTPAPPLVPGSYPVDEAVMRNRSREPVVEPPAPPGFLDRAQSSAQAFFGDVRKGLATQPVTPGVALDPGTGRSVTPPAGDSSPPPAPPPPAPPPPAFVPPDPVTAAASASGVAAPPLTLQDGDTTIQGGSGTRVQRGGQMFDMAADKSLTPIAAGSRVRYTVTPRPGYSPIIKGFDEATGTFLRPDQLPQQYRDANLTGQLQDAGGGYMAQQIDQTADAKLRADTARDVAGVRGAAGGARGDADRSEFIRKFLESRAAANVPIAQTRAELAEYIKTYDETGGRKPGVAAEGGKPKAQTPSELVGERFRRLLPTTVGGKAVAPDYAKTRAALETLPGASPEEIGGLASMVAAGEFGDPEAIVGHIAESAARDYARYGMKPGQHGTATVGGPDGKPLFSLVTNHTFPGRVASEIAGNSPYNEIHLPNGQVVRPADPLPGTGLGTYFQTGADKARYESQMTAASNLLHRVRQIQADARQPR